MTHNITKDLHEVLRHIQSIDSSRLNNQQLTFVQHIEKTTRTLLDGQLQYLPTSEYAHIHILPTLGDSLIQPIVAVYGYAKLLLDSPASFDGATIPEAQRPQLDFIYQTGRALQAYIETIIDQAHHYRLTARQAPPHNLDVRQFIVKHRGIYDYWLRQQNAGLKLFIDDSTYFIHATPYHLNALLQHCIVTPITEFATDSNGVFLYLQASDDSVQIIIRFSDIQLHQSQMQTLFQKDGRNHYLKQLQTMHGQIMVSPQSQSTLVLAFPQVAL